MLHGCGDWQGTAGHTTMHIVRTPQHSNRRSLHELFTSITTSDVMHNVGGSDHLPVSLHKKRPTFTQHLHQSLLRCPPVLKWRGPETLYSSNVQQAIANRSMRAAP
jgi:hypothetical protein